MDSSQESRFCHALRRKQELAVVRGDQRCGAPTIRCRRLQTRTVKDAQPQRFFVHTGFVDRACPVLDGIQVANVLARVRVVRQQCRGGVAEAMLRVYIEVGAIDVVPVCAPSTSGAHKPHKHSI